MALVSETRSESWRQADWFALVGARLHRLNHWMSFNASLRPYWTKPSDPVNCRPPRRDQ